MRKLLITTLIAAVAIVAPARSADADIAYTVPINAGRVTVGVGTVMRSAPGCIITTRQGATGVVEPAWWDCPATVLTVAPKAQIGCGQSTSVAVDGALVFSAAVTCPVVVLPTVTRVGNTITFANPTASTVTLYAKVYGSGLTFTSPDPFTVVTSCRRVHPAGNRFAWITACDVNTVKAVVSPASATLVVVT